MSNDTGRVAEATGLSSDDQAPAGLAPSGFDPSREILFRCPKCCADKFVEKLGEDPPGAWFAEMVCPRCDDGDFHSPTYFDADGNWINPVEHLA